MNFRSWPALKHFFIFNQLLLLRWHRDKVSCYAASLAYYSLFSLAPLLIICTSLIGLTFDRQLVETQILDVASFLMGQEGSQQIRTMIINAHIPSEGLKAEILSFIILLIGASGSFSQIQIGLNAILPKARQKLKKGWFKWLVDRFFSFALVLGVAFLLLVSLIFSIMLSFFSHYLASFFAINLFLTWCFDFLISFVVISCLFGLIYKILPDTSLGWSEIIFGAMIAAFLFILGKFFLSFYLGTKHVANAFGPAGALVIILIWLYYSAQILFLGAEIITIKKLKLVNKYMKQNPDKMKKSVTGE